MPLPRRDRIITLGSTAADIREGHGEVWYVPNRDFP